MLHPPLSGATQEDVQLEGQGVEVSGAASSARSLRSRLGTRLGRFPEGLAEVLCYVAHEAWTEVSAIPMSDHSIQCIPEGSEGRLIDALRWLVGEIWLSEKWPFIDSQRRPRKEAFCERVPVPPRGGRWLLARITAAILDPG
jgi:hypothetical protein